MCFVVQWFQSGAGFRPSTVFKATTKKKLTLDEHPYLEKRKATKKPLTLGHAGRAPKCPGSVRKRPPESSAAASAKCRTPASAWQLPQAGGGRGGQKGAKIRGWSFFLGGEGVRPLCSDMLRTQPSAIPTLCGAKATAL